MRPLAHWGALALLAIILIVLTLWVADYVERLFPSEETPTVLISYFLAFIGLYVSITVVALLTALIVGFTYNVKQRSKHDNSKRIP